LIVAQYVVMEGVSDDDFEWQFQTCIASVLIVLMDTIPTMEDAQVRLVTQRREELIVRIFQHCDVWGLHVFKDVVGAFLYKKNRGESLIEIRMHMYGDVTYISAKVQLRQGVREFLNRSCGCCVLQDQPEPEEKRALARTLHSAGLGSSA
jgi:hypothetical protein